MFFHLNPQPRMLCAKIGCNWLSGSGEEIFFYFVNVFSLFRNYIGNGCGLSFEQTWIHIPKGCFASRMVYISTAVLGKNIFIFRRCIFAILQLFPLQKDMAPHLSNLESTSLENALCQVWLKFDQWFCRRRWNWENFTTTTTTTTTTDNGHILIRNVHFSLRLRWANRALRRVTFLFIILCHIKTFLCGVWKWWLPQVCI